MNRLRLLISTTSRSMARRVLIASTSLALVVAAVALAASTARAGGQGADIPPYPLPVRQTEFRLATQARMVCVDNPSIICNAPYLDAPSTASNTDGATLRSTACPGPPPGACRPDYIAGAEITGELSVDWPIVRSTVGGVFPPPDPEPALTCDSESYKICHVNGRIELNITAPGVAVSNPVIVLDSTSAEMNGTNNECRCISPFDLEGKFEGEKIGRIGFADEDWWYTRNVGATCDVALEYSEFIRRDIALIREIGETAFPDLLCPGLGPPPCGSNATPIFVEPDGSLTKGCGTAPSNTFTIRFALPNEPLVFFEKTIVGGAVPKAVADVDGDSALDLLSGDISKVLINDGSNTFSEQPTSLSGSSSSPVLTDWTDDGDVDLVVDENGPGVHDDVRVYPGNGAGTFSNASSFLIAQNSAQTNNGTFRILTDDFNNDGLPDGFWDTNVTYNQTNGPIAPTTDFVSLDDDSSSLADMNGDSQMDILAGSFNSPVVEWGENQGPGTFTEQALLTLPEADELGPLVGQGGLDFLQCDPFGNDCCSMNRTGGCEDNSCESAVCNEDSSCCNSEWSDFCGELAREMCAVCIDPAKPDCCDQSTAKVGCEIPSCAAIVCEMDSFCCAGPWDSFCVREAERWCSECRVYDVSCSEPEVRRASGADVDGDGDTDLILALEVPQHLDHPRNLIRPRPIYLTWLPNRQIEDPVLAAGDPLFDPALSPWEPIGRGSSTVEIADLDGDGDPDLVSQADERGYWYRNDEGSFTGPYAIRGAVTWPPDQEDTGFEGRVLVADTDDDTDSEVIISDKLYEQVPEPGLLFGLGTGALLLWRLDVRRHRRRGGRSAAHPARLSRGRHSSQAGGRP